MPHNDSVGRQIHIPNAGRGPSAWSSGSSPFIQTLNELLQIERFELLEFIEQGDRIVVLCEDTVRVRATGGTVDFYWAHVFEMRDGKVIRFREYGDTAPLVAELQAAQEIAR